MKFIKEHLIAIIFLIAISLTLIINYSDDTVLIKSNISDVINTTSEDEISFDSDDLKLGSYKYGGIIFYVNKNDGHENNYLKGYALISAINDIDKPYHKWSKKNILIGTEEEIGKGLSNTNKIVSILGDDRNNSLAAEVKAFSYKNYNDWYLPSIDELELMYDKRKLINDNAVKAGGDKFNYNWYYHSSTEHDKSNKFGVGFGAGLTGYSSKTGKLGHPRGTRPIRTLFFKVKDGVYFMENTEDGDTENEEDEDRIRAAEERMKKIEEENRKLRADEDRRKRMQDENKRKSQSKFVTKTTDNGKYEGLYRNGDYHGKGKYTWNDGDVYDGNWVDGVKSGKGTYTWASGAKYIGQWKEDKMTGKGTMSYSNGNKYEGDWLNDERTGKGTYTWADDGTKYIGQYKDSKRTGRGKYIYSNGSFMVGKWDEKKEELIEDVYNITINRSNKQLTASLENDNKNLRYRIYVNGNYSKVIYNYGFTSKRNSIKASPGDLISIDRNSLKRERWYNKCTSFRVQENKYNYSITCN